MNFILGKYILHYTKETFKALKIILIALAIIVAIIAIKFKPAYEVSIDGTMVGYIEDEEKDRICKKIDYFLNNTEGCIAFIEATINPEYKLTLVRRGTKTVEDEVLAKVENTAITTYRTYAISVDGETKSKVDSLQSAEEIVNKVKEGVQEEVKLDLAITEVLEKELAVSSKDDALSTLNGIKNDKILAYEEAKAKEEARIALENAQKALSSGGVNTSSTVSYDYAPIQIALIRPVDGSISSRFGARSSIRSSVHTGLDIASPSGTPIKSASSGVVSYAGMKGAYGNLVVITHENGVETYYAHCSSLNVSAGQTVSQGDIVGFVGSTGNSTGPHLHLEVRINGVAQNPQNYIY